MWNGWCRSGRRRSIPDYGQELWFGVFATPDSRDPERVLALADVAERSDLDLVTFQDHPYQPAFLDTWTLMAVVAARTQRIRIAASVHNLPLRLPSVLARSAASLDLLSGGRIELGLGAGSFWTAIEAMGGTRLDPGEAVQSVAEAIEIIRQLWDTETVGGVRVNGEHYHVSGVKRGPAPAHDMEIWVGAYGPRMLELTGRLGDGWLPSLAYMEPGQLTRSNRRIDEAAEEADRSPAEIRRLINIGGKFSSTSEGFLQGPVEQWVDEITELALTEGMSSFILASDTASDLGRFAGEVAPAVRERVEAER